jgi:hypothetical protein
MRSPQRAGLLREEGRGFFQDLALLAQDPVLAAQPAQFFLFVSGQAVTTLPFIQLRLFYPQPERLAR